MTLVPEVVDLKLLERLKEVMSADNPDYEKWFKHNKTSLAEDMMACILYCSMKSDTGTVIHGLQTKQCTEVIADYLNETLHEVIQHGIPDDSDWWKLAELKNLDVQQLKSDKIPDKKVKEFHDKLSLVRKHLINKNINNITKVPEDDLRRIVGKNWAKKFFLATIRKLHWEK